MDSNLISASLLRDFSLRDIVLYIGQGVTDSDLSDRLCCLPWSCVVTSQTDDRLSGRFQTEGCQPHSYYELADMPANLFQHRVMPIIHLYGGALRDTDELPEEIRKQFFDKQADNKLSFVLSKMENTNAKMVVVGFSIGDENEFPASSFVTAWYEKPTVEMAFFGTRGKDFDKINAFRQAAEKRGLVWQDSSLAELLDEAGSVEQPFESMSGAQIFFKAHKPVSISSDILMRCDYFASLLTEQAVRGFIPYGKELQKRWFLNFLHNSASHPQWYGYIQNTDFYLKRSFEDKFVNLVRGLLSGKGLVDTSYNSPVILEGPPGSSKSIELGALAYRVFNEEMNPVIFINNDSLTFTPMSDEFLQLDELLLEIERHGETDMRTLIVWDSASYRNVANETDTLIRALSNNGRRFVLVCTAYEHSDKSEQNSSHAKWFRFTPAEQFEQIKQSERDKDNDIYFDGRRYFVKSTRTMDDHERIQFRNKVEKYAGINRDNWKWSKIEGEGKNDIFYYFFMLIRSLQPQLSHHLDAEQIKVNRFVQKQLDIIVGETVNEEPEMTPMMIAMRDAGIKLDFSDQDLKSINEEEREIANQYDLESFSTCIAIFSQFKIDTPASLALSILCPENKALRQNVYKMLDSFTYIQYCQEDNGFVFRFRHTLEAELFIVNKQISVRTQIELIIRMLDYYVEVCKELHAPDEELAKSLQRLLRMIGPNTEYEPFKNGKRCEEHNSLMRKLNIIIEKLEKMRIEERISDDEARFAMIEITFTREYYGKLWPKMQYEGNLPNYSRESDLWEEYPAVFSKNIYENRMKKLKGAVNLIKKSREKINDLLGDNFGFDNKRKSYLIDQLNSLAVEISLCNTQIKILKDYCQKFCKKYEVPTGASVYDIKPEPYLELYQILYKAIVSDPTNGYAYNALFQMFENEYERLKEVGDRAGMMKLLSGVRFIADDVSVLDIKNRGMDDDELSRHIMRISEYSREVPIRIDDILSGKADDDFLKLFNDMIEKNNAAAICFVAQQELDRVNLDGNSLAKSLTNVDEEYKLNDRQRNACKRIMEFICRSEYAECVENDHFALYLLLRVSWMYHNRRLLDDSHEAKITELSDSAWKDIADICERYNNRAGEKGRPVAGLLLALSRIHLNQNYSQAMNIIENLNNTRFGFAFTPRMRVPYLLCDSNGVPKVFSGRVISIDANNRYGGYLQVDGLPNYIGRKRGVRFISKNLGLRQRPKEHAFLSDLELGLGYMGFSAYTEKGRKGEM